MLSALPKIHILSGPLLPDRRRCLTLKTSALELQRGLLCEGKVGGGLVCHPKTRWESMLSGIGSCSLVAIRIWVQSVRCEQPARRQKHNPVKQRPVFFPPLLPVASQESLLKVPKRGPKRCDSCAQGALGRRTVSRRNLCDAKLLAKGCG